MKSTKFPFLFLLIIAFFLVSCVAGISSGSSSQTPDQAMGTLLTEDADAPLSIPGKSAYEVAVDHGFVGTEEEWLASLRGGSSSGDLYAASYGIVPGNVDMEAMKELLSLASEEGRTIRFDSGTYVFPSTIELLSNTSIIGSANTVFTLSQSSSSSILVKIGTGVDNVYLSHLILMGSETALPATQGSKTGLHISRAIRVNIENVEICGFDNYGFYAEQMSSNNAGEFYKMLQITNCRFYNNYFGMCLGPRCEYTQVINCVFGSNNTGCLNQGGNNSYVSCIFNKNQIGFRMDSKNLSNPAHGGCNGCAFNHNSKAIVVNDCTIGWIFNGCQIFYGTVDLNKSSGVVFNSCIFGSCVLNSKNPNSPNSNLISDSFFQTDSAKILSGNDGSTYVTNCLPDHISQPETDKPATEEDGWTEILYTQSATVTSGASVNAYFAPISHQIPANTPIDVIDIVIRGATAAGQTLKDVDLWIGNAETGEVTEAIVSAETLTTVYSSRLNAYVLRIELGHSFDYPVFFAMEAERTGGRGIAYGHSSESINFFSGSGISVGDVLTANHTYIPEFAVYSKN